MYTLIQSVHIWVEITFLNDSIIIVMHISRLHIETEQLKGEATP